MGQHADLVQKILEDRKKSLAAAEAAALAEKNAADARPKAFESCLDQVVFPAFDDFINDMTTNGLEAARTDGKDGRQLRYTDVMFRADGGKLNSPANENSVLRVKLREDGVVEITLFCDQRSERTKPTQTMHHLSAITRELIDLKLRSFIVDTFNSRKT